MFFRNCVAFRYFGNHQVYNDLCQQEAKQNGLSDRL